MRRLFALLLLAASPAAATEIGGGWQLVGVEGQPAPAPLTLTFTAEGSFSGKAPCNRFYGRIGGELPALTLGQIAATRMACPDLAVESAYLQALEATVRAEVTQDHLFLFGAKGGVLEFVREGAEPLASAAATDPPPPAPPLLAMRVI
ncbi:MAG: META domain-containing protein [Paracoccaceae bacterium]